MKLYDERRGDGPLIVNFPHSGTDVPPDIAARLTPAGRSLVDTDWHVDRLYGFARDFGASTLRARYSRYVVDLNRDPAGVSLYPGARTTGVCPTETFEGVPLYAERDEPGVDEIERRIAQYWSPYHARLRATIDETVERHGYALLIDGHSIFGRLPLLFDGELPDINFGTNSGRSCARQRVDAAVSAASSRAYSVVVDGRFKGGYITRHYGDPDRGVHALQIELNANTYLANGSRFAWDDGKATALGAVLRGVCAAFALRVRNRGDIER